MFSAMKKPSMSVSYYWNIGFNIHISCWFLRSCLYITRIVIVVLAIRQCASWPSTLITHKHFRHKKTIRRFVTRSPSSNWDHFAHRPFIYQRTVRGTISHQRGWPVGVPAHTFDSHDGRQISRRTRSSRREPRRACIASTSERSSLFFNTLCRAAALRLLFIHRAYLFCNPTSTYTLHAKASALHSCFSWC